MGKQYFIIHTTIGLYADGSFKVNGVLPNDLKAHVEYNRKFRLGRALFVDGTCINKGCLSDDQLKDFEERIKRENLKADKYISPYE